MIAAFLARKTRPIYIDTTLRWSATALALVTITVPAQTLYAEKEKTAKVPIFVTASQVADGFTDPSEDRRDSVKDLLLYLKRSKQVVPVETAARAVLVLEVIGREHQRTRGKEVTVRLTAGTFSAHLTGDSRNSYLTAARDIAKQVDQWVKANRQRLEQVSRSTSG
jgi:hypothetical protein